ncbi:MAG TPA: DUF131 domain-containing protein [Candidatus Bathyarchaeia archaeon]|nr:DUF131 domain-containing protein [Candidatus Bathyarchaeia archaeon]
MFEAEEHGATSSLPLKLFLFGFVLMFAGVIVLVASALLGGDGTVSGGAIIFVGPIPIVLGAGPYAPLAIVLAAVLTIIGFIVFFWMRKQVARS